MKKSVIKKLNGYASAFLLMSLSFQIYAKSCEIPLDRIAVGSILLMQDFSDFKSMHPQAEIKNNEIVGGWTDYWFASNGVISMDSIDYDAAKDKIIGFSLSYIDGSNEEYTSSLLEFKDKLIRSSVLPKTNWVLNKNKNEYVYSCSDYNIIIHQDHGIERHSMGAVVMVHSRYSDFFH